MACSEMVKNNPQGNLDDITYENLIQKQSSQNGQLCVIAHFSSGCGAQCNQLSKNYDGCNSCLGNSQSCGVMNGSGKMDPCCPFIAAAIKCSNCLGLYNTDALKQCLKQGLSTGAIIGIVIGIVTFMIIIIIIVVVIMKTKKKVEIQRELGLNGQNLEGINLESLKKLQNLQNF